MCWLGYTSKTSQVISITISLVGYDMINITFFFFSISSSSTVFTCRSAEIGESRENEDSPTDRRIGAKLSCSYLQLNKTRMFTLVHIPLSYM